ncbi:MAG: hypothetical protein EOP86_23070 [Verrucomicrobiaceae bacterium]|nr:MAG: hypothetical protein EOP86_23070 [Verrucomicrobiaceae bacterium]
MKTYLLFLALALPVSFTAGFLLAPPADAGASRRARTALFSSGSLSERNAQAARALQEIRNHSDPLDGRLALLDMTDSAGAGDLERLFGSARLSDDVSARNAAAQRWAEIDPAGFQSHLKSLRPDEMDEMNEVATILYRTWAHRDPEAAMAAAKKSELLPGFQGVRGAVVSGVLEDSPEKGFALLSKEKGFIGTQPLKKTVWEKDPARFVKASAVMDGQSDPFSQYAYSYNMRGARNEALALWAEKDFPAALEWAKSSGAQMRASVMPGLLGKLAEKDINQARGIFESLPPSPEREATGPALVAQWAKTDPQAALDWIEEKMTGGRAQAYGSWIAAVATKGMHQAASLLATLPEGEGRDQATRTLAAQWVEKDPKAAVNWIKTMPETADRREAYGSVMYQWAQSDKEGYRNFIATAPFAELPESFGDYSYSGDKTDQEKQVLWAMSLPEDRRTQLFNNAFSQASWNRSAPEIVELLNKVEDPRLKAEAGSQAVQNLVHNDPAKLQSLLNELPAGLLTAEHRENLRRNVEGAQNFSDTEKASILARLK